MYKNYCGNIANGNKHVGVYNLRDEVRYRSWSVTLNILFCGGGFQNVAYGSTKAVGSTWSTVTTNSLLVVSSKLVITLTKLLLWLSHVGWVITN